MHGTMCLKFIDAKQAKDLYNYKNIKRKLYRTNAAIWYNKSCRHKHLTPTYVNIHIKGKNLQDQKTLRTANHYRINQEIKFLYIKKTKLNEQLYKLHLKCAQEWQGSWPSITQSIDYKLTSEMENQYKQLNLKLDKLQREKQTKGKTNTQHRGTKFYSRTVNLTDIRFSQEETALLNNGLQHSIEEPLKKYWINLIMETEQAIRKLDNKLQAPYRILATKKLRQLRASNQNNNVMAKRQTHILKGINNKLEKENATVVKADKGKTCVIIYTDEYNKKVHKFLNENNFQKLPKDPTDKYQKLITKTLQHSDLIIDKKQKQYLTQKKPQPPNLRAQIKLHKPDQPIRPVVNNMNAPAYKTSKLLVNRLNNLLNLRNHYNVKDSATLANDLTKIKLDANHRMITLDIKDLYVNIPIQETLRITRTILLENNDEHTTKQMITLLEVILQQNYFSFCNNIYQPEKGVSMGSPISNIIAEIFLQNLENSHLKQILDKQNITFYTRYVDDILVIYNTKHTSPEIIHSYVNKIHPNLHFNPTLEHNNSISFLDLLIIRHPNQIEIDIFRKPTTTDTTINYTSNHPTEHKMAAYRYLINRMTSFPLSTEKRNTEWQNIRNIAHNNQFPIQHITKLRTQIQRKTHINTAKNNSNQKWATFTYHSPKIRTITNLFKQTELKIAFKSTNNLHQLSKHKSQDITQEHDKSGIYSMICKTCNKAYIGQTSRNLTTRYREHIRYIKNNDPQSAYALHILNNRHEYGPLKDTMELIKPIKKPAMLIPYEQLTIQTFHQNGLLIPEQNCNEHNPLFLLATEHNLT